MFDFGHPQAAGSRSGRRYSPYIPYGLPFRRGSGLCVVLGTLALIMGRSILAKQTLVQRNRLSRATLLWDIP